MKKKLVKLALNRETVRSLDGVKNIMGGGSIAVCGTLAGTTRTEGSYGTCGYTVNESDLCATGGACTVGCPDWP